MTAATTTGSAERHGPLWGARPEDWAVNEEQQLPTYEEALRRVGPVAGRRVLEVGCGSGVFLRAAVDRGAQVVGVDASETLVALARARVPEADVRVGDMQFLPFEDDSFDVVAGFNSFFFAADMVAALREAGRVARPGGPVVVQVWGRPDHCDLTAMKHAVMSLLAPDPDRPAPPSLATPGVLEEIATAAGLTPVEAFDISWAFTFPDDDSLARAMLSPGLIIEVIDRVGEERVREAILRSLRHHRAEDGSYSLRNEWHFLIART